MTDLFGANWRAARGIVPYAGLAVAFTSFANAAISGLRAMRAASENLRLSVVMVPFLFVLSLGGAELYGTRGAGRRPGGRRRHLHGAVLARPHEGRAGLRPRHESGRGRCRGGGLRAVTVVSAVGDVDADRGDGRRSAGAVETGPHRRHIAAGDDIEGRRQFVGVPGRQRRR